MGLVIEREHFGQGRALLRNQEVRAETADPRVVLEIDRFNLELNLTPAPLAGRPFAAMASELDQALGIVHRAAAWHGGRVVMVGILPTLAPDDLQLAALSDAPRYRALNNGLRRLRQEPFRVRIHGADPLELAADDVGLEGANTSFQVHLRVDPDRFADHFNAAQLATGPVLAVAGNSPTFLGHRLWQETRVALFHDAHAVANAGLLLHATLADRLGIEAVVDELVDLGDRPGHHRPGRKVLTLVHALVAGGDCIDDADLLRTGSTAAVLGHRVMAPSTLGTFLRSFTFGHIRQLDRVAETVLARAWAAGAGPGDGPMTIDVDSTVCEVHGHTRAAPPTGTPASSATTRCWPPGPTPARCCMPASAPAGRPRAAARSGSSTSWPAGSAAPARLVR